MPIVDHRGVLDLIARNAQIVDVLPWHEYRTSHIAGALHLPLKLLLSQANGVLDREGPIVVYCRDSL